MAFLLTLAHFLQWMELKAFMIKWAVTALTYVQRQRNKKGRQMCPRLRKRKSREYASEWVRNNIPFFTFSGMKGASFSPVINSILLFLFQ